MPSGLQKPLQLSTKVHFQKKMKKKRHAICKTNLLIKIITNGSAVNQKKEGWINLALVWAAVVLCILYCIILFILYYHIRHVPFNYFKYQHFKCMHIFSNPAFGSQSFKNACLASSGSREETWNGKCRSWRYSARMSSMRTIWEKMRTRCPLSRSRSSSLSSSISLPLLFTSN